ncbi:MAG: carbon starvation protein A [Candidatus Omnitrophota bacterium]
MNSLWLMLAGICALYAGYRYYAAFVEKKIWQVDYKRQTPAFECNDGVDYLPAKHWSVLFGHHFSSIAGAGPIIGPVIACALFGWGPALLWVILGSIFIGGIHDYSALVLSLRNKGKSVGHISEVVINRRCRLVFSLFLWLALVLIVAVFAAVTAQTLMVQPEIVIPTFGLIPIALLFGYMVYRWNINQWLATLIAVVLMAVSIYAGVLFPIHLGFNQAMSFWTAVLLIYAYIASVIPVNLLLQPRDYLSMIVLFLGLLLGYAGIFVTHPRMSAPFFTSGSSAQGPLWPAMFVLIACGAISGFHSLVSSGTTSKQLPRKSDAKRITFGGMLLEAAMSMLAIIAVCAGLFWKGGPEGMVYPELAEKSGWIVTFGKGYGNLTAPLVGAAAGTMIAVFLLNSFVMTTLDTATRITRYLTEEIFGDSLKMKQLNNKYVSGLISVAAAACFAFGSWQVVWPVFGAANQLIAALVLLTASVYLLQKNRPSLYTLLPALFMSVTTIFSLCFGITGFWKQKNYILVTISAALLLLAGDMLKEACRAMSAVRRDKTGAV